ncbi:MAG: hypothetical protein MJB12_10975 [Firmicutes bacterium]|nr:hypothetical protein [Bacillota bacterium]
MIFPADNIKSESPVKTKKAAVFKTLKKNTMLLCLGVSIFLFMLSYLPVPVIYPAFIRYNYRLGIFRSPFVGFDSVRFLLMSGNLWTLAKNTVLYHFSFILIGNSLQVLAAVLLNGIGQKWFKKTFQTMMLLPHFISFVLVGLFAYNMLSYDYGLVNSFLKNVAMEPIKTHSNPSIWPAILVLTHL